MKPRRTLKELRAINLHFHDLRHEAGSRFIEAGWPIHHADGEAKFWIDPAVELAANFSLKPKHRSSETDRGAPQ
jgi:hypothetical protein